MGGGGGGRGGGGGEVGLRDTAHKHSDSPRRKWDAVHETESGGRSNRDRRNRDQPPLQPQASPRSHVMAAKASPQSSPQAGSHVSGPAMSQRHHKRSRGSQSEEGISYEGERKDGRKGGRGDGAGPALKAVPEGLKMSKIKHSWIEKEKRFKVLAPSRSALPSVPLFRAPAPSPTPCFDCLSPL